MDVKEGTILELVKTNGLLLCVLGGTIDSITKQGALPAKQQEAEQPKPQYENVLDDIINMLQTEQTMLGGLDDELRNQIVRKLIPLT